MARTGDAFKRYVRLEHVPEALYPYRCAGWRNVGGFNVGDKYTEEVGELIVESLRGSDVEIIVEEVEHAANKP